ERCSRHDFRPCCPLQRAAPQNSGAVHYTVGVFCADAAIAQVRRVAIGQIFAMKLTDMQAKACTPGMPRSALALFSDRSLRCKRSSRATTLRNGEASVGSGTSVLRS